MIDLRFIVVPFALAICAPPSMVRAFARTITEPPAPEFSPVADAAIWVLATPAPSRINAPGVVTLTDPPAPAPAVRTPAKRIACARSGNRHDLWIASLRSQ